MKTILILMVTFLSSPAFAGSQLNCSVDEYANQNTLHKQYDLSTPLDAASNASIDSQTGKLLNVSFGAETFVSKGVVPGKQLILISVTGKQGVSSTVGGENTAIEFYDDASGSFEIQCSVP